MRLLVSYALAGLLALSAPAALPAQQRPTPDTETATAAPAKAPPDAVTHHRITIGGQTVAYTATAGTIKLQDDDGNPTASVFYIAYTKDGVEDPSRRPVTFAYNGGPGSASVWLHMGALGPRRVQIPDTTHAPPPPYTLVDNAYTPLDRTDLVFIDPVGTGYSHPLEKAKGKDFWGVDQDVESLAQFIGRYLSQNGRWNSPRYLLGESYGTTRSAALVNYLQTRRDMDFNGVVLISVVLNFQTIGFTGANDLPYILYLPSYAAVAWYHDALPNRPPELEPLLREVEKFATTDYAQALLAGSSLDPAVRKQTIARLHQYTGLSEDYLDKADLRVDNSQFEKELMREHDVVLGRLDARFTGPTGDLLAERAFYDPQSAAISSAFTSAFNTYIHRELNYTETSRYKVSGNVRPWDWTHGGRRGWPGFTDVATDLSQALQYNTRLQVLVNNGLYDLATPYFATVYTMGHLGLPQELQSHIHRMDYRAGHMMYLHEPSLAKLGQSIRDFVDSTTGTAAKAPATH